MSVKNRKLTTAESQAFHFSYEKSAVELSTCSGRQQNWDWRVSFCGLDEDGATVNGLVTRDASVCRCWNSQASG